MAWSGGKDSTVVLHMARQADPNVPVVFFHSGLEFPETYDYLVELTKAWRLNLEVIPAEPGALEVMVAGGGWDLASPRPGGRGSLHEALITRPAALRFTADAIWRLPEVLSVTPVPDLQPQESAARSDFVGSPDTFITNTPRTVTF